MSPEATTRKPSWLRAKLPSGPGFAATRRLVDDHQLHTVCQSAQCPNLGECWSRGTATVMILGNICTRSCTFCAIETGRPTELDLDEPARVAEAVAKMRLRHCVITSVARDDLKDGGASVWAATIRAVRYRNPQCAIEVLIPDMQGRQDQLDTILDAKPDILKASRKRRIAAGAGVPVQEVNRLLNQFEQTQKMMKMMAKGGMAKMMRSMKSMFPGMR